MTQDKTPSEADLVELIRMFGYTTSRQTDEIARAVLAKWGSPVVAGGPIGSVHKDSLAMLASGQVKPWDGGARLHPAGKARFDTDYASVYATPQPTQAQAGAVPLTQAKVVEAFCALPHQVQFITAFDQGVRFAERHHGIKEGGHHVVKVD